MMSTSDFAAVNTNVGTRLNSFFKQTKNVSRFVKVPININGNEEYSSIE